MNADLQVLIFWTLLPLALILWAKVYFVVREIWWKEK